MQERIQYLFKKFLNNTCSKEEFEEVFIFIKSAETDAEIRTLLDITLAEFNNEEEGLMRLNAFVNNHGELVNPVHTVVENRNAGKKSRRSLLMYATAACVVIAVFFLWRFNVVENNIKKTNTTIATIQRIKQSTERLQYRYIVLPDSTEVWLNTESELEFPQTFSQNKREVVLTGEAFFDVRHADKIPFIIHTGKVSTEVLGTAFNIKAYPNLDKITVSVKRGKVKVKYIEKQVALLGVGEQVSIAVNDSTVKAKKLSEQEVSAWQQGKLVYDDDTVEDITKDLGRVFNNSVQIKDPAISNLRISTSFTKDAGLEKALEILCRLTDTKLSKENNIYYIK